MSELSEEKKKALLQKWEKWWASQPEERIIGGVVLKKQLINGVPVYSAPVDVRLERIQ